MDDPNVKLLIDTIQEQIKQNNDSQNQVLRYGLKGIRHYIDGNLEAMNVKLDSVIDINRKKYLTFSTNINGGKKLKLKIMPKLSEYLKDTKGKPSFTRLQSYYFMWFFFLINIGIILSLFFGKVDPDVNTIIVLISFEALLLIAVFAPKQFNKVQEIKELIEIAKNGKE